MEIPIVNKILPVNITSEAVKQILFTIKSKNISSNEYGLRVGMKGGGCSASFLLGFDKIHPNDHIYNSEGFSVLIDKKHLMYVIGLEIDFEEGENGSGFTFNNPNQK